MTTSSTGAPVVSVAGSSSAAAAGGSVINVSSLVSQLVAAARAPQDSLITSQTQAVTTKISALGTLKSALSTFQSALKPLATTADFAVQTATSSDPTVFSATASSSAVPGSYTVSVSQLAQAEQLVSNAVAGGASAVLGSGTLSISLGTSSFSVTVNGSNDTLTGIAQAINSASDNPGVTAAIITGSDGAHLVLSSTLTGAANTIGVKETDGGGGLAALTYGSGNTANYRQSVTPQDASFSISGIPYSSSSNTVSGALTGVALRLTGASAQGSSATLTVASDTAQITSNINAFVSAYNTLEGQLSQLGSFDATTNSAGPMLGDPLLEGARSQIDQALHAVVSTGSATYDSLASVGIASNSDGTLSVNASTLQNALATNLGAVEKLFSGTSGVAATLNTTLTNMLSSTGAISSRSQTLVKQENALTDQENQLNTQMTAMSASLTQQYSALNTLLSSLQTTSAYLTQAFASLPQVQQKNSG